ncbi:MAG: hypothetical protein M0P27_09695, partial [Bacteroidales bacterium]|nr:hypothetical protein [Bacteroidales bacterium]
DLDGNLTWDGIHWSHGWDAENRLISSSNFTSGVLCEYAYDYQSRRISKTTLTPNPYSCLTTKYIWDGWNIAAEIIIDQTIFTTNVNYYTWGLDLSGTLQGAGGVGGLLSDTKVTSYETNTYFAVGDVNGNITEYMDTIGAIKAHYKYNSAGEITYQSGTMADDFTHRFSTKPFDKATKLVVYQRRYYDPLFHRFISSDPIGVDGGLHIYGNSGNDVVNKWDYLGLKYGNRLTKKEAEQLACAINQFLKYAPLGNAITAWGANDKSLTIRFLKNYMSKSCSPIILSYNLLKKDNSIIEQNKKAYKHLLSNPSGNIDLVAYTHNDLSTSVGRVVINYSKQFGFIKAHFPSEKYTFSDTKNNDKINVSFPGLNYFEKKCCWEGGEHVSDKWMHDLEIYGHAKSFNVRASWQLLSDINLNQ